VLVSAGLTLESGRERVATLVVPGAEAPAGRIPFTPRAKKVLELSLREALRLGHSDIAPEHLLLGLLHMSDGIAARVLSESGVDAKRTRAQLIERLPAPDPNAGPLAAVTRRLR
jgi:ATP-dependent Clp protease ATP-binding subunit ClpC